MAYTREQLDEINETTLRALKGMEKEGEGGEKSPSPLPTLIPAIPWKRMTRTLVYEGPGDIIDSFRNRRTVKESQYTMDARVLEETITEETMTGDEQKAAEVAINLTQRGANRNLNRDFDSPKQSVRSVREALQGQAFPAISGAYGGGGFTK